MGRLLQGPGTDRGFECRDGTALTKADHLLNALPLYGRVPPRVRNDSERGYNISQRYLVL